MMRPTPERLPMRSGSRPPSPARRLLRHWHMLRHVPLRQLWRRAELMASYRLAPWLPDSRAPAPPLRPRFASSPLPLHADRARFEDGTLTLRLPWGERRFADPIAWSPPPAAGATAASDWARLHYMEYLVFLGDDAFRHLVESWIAGNPRRGRGAVRYAWRPYNLSIRVVGWMYELARRRSRLDAAFLERAAASVAAQIRFLERHLETDLRGNHLIRNIRALLCAGAFFAGSEAERWSRLGARLLARELEEQVLPDGMHYERSPTYHCQVLGDLIDCRVWLPSGPLREALDARLEAMLRVAHVLTHPDGGVALFNDGALSGAHAVALLERSLLSLLGARPTPPRGAFALPQAGYFGWRGEDELFVVDCGPLGPDYLIGHGHCDMLSFEWSVAGRRLIVDPGTYCYPEGRRRHLSRGTASHNTLAIAGEEQSDIYGAFRCGRRARPRLRSWRESPHGFLFEGSHDGYGHLPGAPEHVRRIAFEPGRMRLSDRLTADAGRPAATGFLLHPDWRVDRLSETRVRMSAEGAVVEMEASVPVTLEEGEWYPELYVARPTVRLRVAPVTAGEGVEMRFERRA